MEFIPGIAPPITIKMVQRDYLIGTSGTTVPMLETINNLVKWANPRTS
jgi:hypothetical protein